MLALAATAGAPWLVTAFTPALACAISLSSFVLVWLGFRRAGWVSADHRIVGVSWLPESGWRLTDRCNRTIEGVLRSDSRVGGRCVWLRWDTDGLPFNRKSMLLTAGDIPERDLRRLVVRLRIEGPAHDAAGPQAGIA